MLCGSFVDIDKLERLKLLQGVPLIMEIIFPHWISTQPACPAAKLLVDPQDFSFLNQVHGHNYEKFAHLARVNPDGFPWPEALESEVYVRL